MPIHFRQKSVAFKGAIVKKIYIVFSFTCLVVGAGFILNRAILPGILACVVSIFFAYLWRCAVRKVKRCKAGFCVCGETMAYHSGVTYEKHSQWTTTRINGNCNEILTTTYADIRIYYPCLNCSRVKEFRHMICTGEIYKNTAGEVLRDRKYSAEQAIIDFFDDLRICS